MSPAQSANSTKSSVDEMGQDSEPAAVTGTPVTPETPGTSAASGSSGTPETPGAADGTGTARASAKRRRKYTRSYFGCQKCKSRKVKCDEGRPSCSNCARIRVPCVYGQNRWETQEQVPVPGNQPEQAQVLPRLPHCPSASVETYLLYYWVTHTAATIAPSGYEALLRQGFAEAGFKHRFVLDTLFLFTAAHLNHVDPCREHADLVLHYHTLGSAGLRNEISKGISMENGEAVAISSTLLSLYVLVCNSEFIGILENVTSMYRGMRKVYKQMWNWKDSTRLSVLKPLPMTAIGTGDGYRQDILKVLERQDPSTHSKYIKVIEDLAILTEAINRDATQNYMMFVTKWLSNLPDEFVEQLALRDPCALVIVCRFFDVMSKQKFWYLDSYSKQHYWRVYNQIPRDWKQYL
uniref:ARAD1C10120p n=1 Tax=Blastobotrys adeninivorans TaxID=409370 RepID=A0A060T0Q2_BLAAD